MEKSKKNGRNKQKILSKASTLMGGGQLVGRGER